MEHLRPAAGKPATLPAGAAPNPAEQERAEFHARFVRSFTDPRFDTLREAVAALEERAWRQYCERRQAPAQH